MRFLANSAARRGVAAGIAALREGAPLLDVVEITLREAEVDRSERSVGLGGRPNILGELELDAGLMDGRTRRSGAVAALSGFLHPISVARQVLERLPHEILVGEGAARFAREIGAEPGEALLPEVEAEWRAWLAANSPAGTVTPVPATPGPNAPLADLVWKSASLRSPRGTAVVLVSDGANLASGTSTSGWAYKYPGRLGDSPLVGSGHYADSRAGAAACTHTGEMTIRAGTARAVVLTLETGLPIEEACRRAIGDLRRLRDGFLSDVVIYALNVKGGHFAASTGAEAEYWWWETGMAEPQRRRPTDLGA